MNAYLLPGVTGLLLGLTLHWAGFSRSGALRDALALRRSYGLRSGLYALGFSMALTALLCWLAVIDVDKIEVLSLSAGALAGGAVFGVAAGLCGYTPLTAFAGVGGGAALEVLSVLAGSLLASLALPALTEPLSALQAIPPLSATTLFEVTLDEPFLLGGGFLGQGCAGLLLMAIAACVPSPRVKAAIDPEDTSKAEAETEGEPSQEEEDAPEGERAPEEIDVPAPKVLLLPAAVPEDTFVALLPGEEPLVVDTLLDNVEAEADTPESEAVPEAEDAPESAAQPEETVDESKE